MNVRKYIRNIHYSKISIGTNNFLILLFLIFLLFYLFKIKLIRSKNKCIKDYIVACKNNSIAINVHHETTDLLYYPSDIGYKNHTIKCWS